MLIFVWVLTFMTSKRRLDPTAVRTSPMPKLEGHGSFIPKPSFSITKIGRQKPSDWNLDTVTSAPLGNWVTICSPRAYLGVVKGSSKVILWNTILATLASLECPVSSSSSTSPAFATVSQETAPSAGWTWEKIDTFVEMKRMKLLGLPFWHFFCLTLVHVLNYQSLSIDF